MIVLPFSFRRQSATSRGPQTLASLISARKKYNQLVEKNSNFTFSIRCSEKLIMVYDILLDR